MPTDAGLLQPGLAVLVAVRSAVCVLLTRIGGRSTPAISRQALLRVIAALSTLSGSSLVLRALFGPARRRTAEHVAPARVYDHVLAPAFAAPMPFPHRPSFRRAAALALVLLSAGCATPDPTTPAGQPVLAPAVHAPGTAFVFRTFNAYNREPRATVTQRFDAHGSRVEGMDYQDAGLGGFGTPRAPIVNRVHNPAGDLVALERADGSRITYDPPLRVLPFPLQPGTRFSQRVTAHEPGVPARRVVLSGRVGGWETVRVPAGEFRALRVVRDLWLGDFDFYKTETRRLEIDWYSPELGAVVRSSEDSVYTDILRGGRRFGGGVEMRGDWLIWELEKRGGH